MKIVDRIYTISALTFVAVGYFFVTIGDLIAEARLQRKHGKNYEGRLAE